MKRSPFLLSPDEPGQAPPAQGDKPASPPAPQDPPPAAAVVAAGKVTESDQAALAEVRKLQTRVAELEDENGQLKKLGGKPARKPAEEDGDLTFYGW